MTKFLNTVSGPKVDVSDIIVTPVIKNADVVPQPEATPSSINMGELNNGSAIVISSPTSITLDAINVSASSEYMPTLDKDLVTKDYVAGALAELDNEKQALLVSGTNIKTINSASLLGAGDITIESGSGVVYSETEPLDDDVIWVDPTEDTEAYFRATQAEAENGINNQNYMTPLRTAQAIAALVGENIPDDIVSSNGSASSITNVWVGTQAQYDAISTKDAATLYFIK